MQLTDLALLSTHGDLIRRIAYDVSRYLDRQQRFQLLWADVDNHIAASHIAESIGDTPLVALHLQAVLRLLTDIYEEYPKNRDTVGYWFMQGHH
jgi:hypothetical protein